jgi:hypothetical protein
MPALPVRRRESLHPVFRPAEFRPRLEPLEDGTLPSTWTVLNLNDSGAGSLRAEVALAQDGDTVNFDASLRYGTVTLTSGELEIHHSVTIQGPGANVLSVSGSHASRVFEVFGGVIATISGLTVTGGMVVGSGDGVLVDTGGTLTLNNSTVGGNSGSEVSIGNGGDGGGIAIAGNSVLPPPEAAARLDDWLRPPLEAAKTSQTLAAELLRLPLS